MLIAACSQHSISFTDYLRGVHQYEKELTVTDSINGLYISAEYLPPVVMALREAGNSENLKSDYSNLTKNYETADYFELSLWNNAKPTKESLREHFKSIDSSETAFEQYLDFGIQNDIKLLAGHDTLPCSYLHREISDAITNRMQYTISFEGENKNAGSDKILLLQLERLETQNIQLTISKEKIANIPSVKNVQL